MPAAPSNSPGTYAASALSQTGRLGGANRGCQVLCLPASVCGQPVSPAGAPHLGRDGSHAASQEGVTCGLRRYLRSARSRSCPLTTRPYGMRQPCAHWPLLVLRPPHASELKHCPLRAGRQTHSSTTHAMRGTRFHDTSSKAQTQVDGAVDVCRWCLQCTQVQASQFPCSLIVR